MADKTVTIRTRKYMTNRLLARKQMVRIGVGRACFPCLVMPRLGSGARAAVAGRRIHASLRASPRRAAQC